MAKRKRLDPARLEPRAASDAPPAEAPQAAPVMPLGTAPEMPGGPLESKSMGTRYPLGVYQPPRRAPIADVAGEASAVAALEEVTRSLNDARSQGRMIQRLALDAIDPGYLVRDRVVVDETEMQALCDSLAARGQQTAIEVADLGGGRWGLISGWRRLTALRRLRDRSETPEDRTRFDTVLAIARQPGDAAEAYLARNGDNTTLIMLNGMAQRLDTEQNRLATAKFRDFSFDISPLVSTDDETDQSVSSMVTPDLLWDWAGLAAQLDTAPGIIAEELHSRLAQPLFCIVAAMIGFATLILGGFSRFGVWREAVIAFGLLIAIDGLRGTLVVQIRETAALWPLAYLPSLIGAVLTLAMLWQAAHPRWIRRRLGGKGATA